jgi:hypothetical protein
MGASESELHEAHGPGKRLGLGARFLIYGLVGWCVEVLFTSVYDVVSGVGDIRLQGYSYLWMHPIWGGGILMCERLCQLLKVKRVHWAWRGPVYALACFAVEAFAGAFLQQTIGRIPWDYTGATWSVVGLIRLDYAPFWAICGWAGEPVWALMRRVRLSPTGPVPVPATPAASPPRLQIVR